MSVRPNCELYPENQESSSPHKREMLPPSPQAQDNKPESDALKSQILQLQLTQAALLSGAAASAAAAASGPAAATATQPDILKFLPPQIPAGSSPNPLLYYGYFSQMLQGLQSQQQRLVEKLVQQQKEQEEETRRKRRAEAEAKKSRATADDIVRSLLERNDDEGKTAGLASSVRRGRWRGGPPPDLAGLPPFAAAAIPPPPLSGLPRGFKLPRPSPSTPTTGGGGLLTVDPRHEVNQCLFNQYF